MEYSIEDTYAELYQQIDKGFFNPFGFDKVILLHSLMLHPEYRKRGVTEEFIEVVHREHHNSNTAIIALVKPFQTNRNDADFYLRRRGVEVRDSISETKIVPSIKFYQLKELVKVEDIEIVEYKLFGVANRCGFDRIDDSHLFMYVPDKTIERMKGKHRDGIYNPDL